MTQETEVTAVGPSPEELDALKKQYGKVYRASYDATEVYYFRRLRRLEYRQIQEMLAKADPNTIGVLHDEKVLGAAVVWPNLKPEWYASSAAGIVPTLAVQILERSGFTGNLTIEEA
jgi:hypothetical protein